MAAKATHKTEKIKTEVNTNDFCRVCMNNEIEMSYLFGESCDYIERIEYCTGLKITKDDGLPPLICKNCTQDLATAYKFKSACLLAHETYNNSMKIEIKIELESNDNSDGFINDNDFVWDDVAKAESVKIKEDVNVEANSLPNKTVSNTFIKSPRKPYKKKPKDPDVSKHKKKIDEPRIWCRACKMDFKTESEKVIHMKSLHNYQSGTWICEHCGKVFKKRGSFRSHKVLHLPPQFSCDQCDYKATFKWDLIKHINMHSGIKNIQCQICAARFRTRSQLTSHTRREHEKVSPKRFMCQLCDKSFNYNYECKRHMDRHTSTKRYQCENCTSSFADRKKWKKHCIVKHNIAMPLLRPGRKKIYETKDITISDT